MSTHPPRLDSKVCLVTGASSGIGRAIATAYASHGTALIVCADLRPDAHGNNVSSSSPDDKLDTHDLINKTHGEGKAIFVKCNVADSGSVEAAVKEAVKVGGRLDV
jgi:NAD(P)-dependent dehydrogenase (short-subunit alcohol dehydrogenase family)